MQDYNHAKLSNYQIAESFGDTLSLIYKEKMEEINNDLEPAYSHLDRLNMPQVPELNRWFARQTLPEYYKIRLDSINHINRIRSLYKKIKSGHEHATDVLNIEKARNIPIESIYDFKRKGRNVSCPLHADDHPSASIKYNRLVCFSCGAKMDGISLFQKLNNVGFKEAVETLGKY